MGGLPYAPVNASVARPPKGSVLEGVPGYDPSVLERVIEAPGQKSSKPPNGSVFEASGEGIIDSMLDESDWRELLSGARYRTFRKDQPVVKLGVDPDGLSYTGTPAHCGATAARHGRVAVMHSWRSGGSELSATSESCLSDSEEEGRI